MSQRSSRVAAKSSQVFIVLWMVAVFPFVNTTPYRLFTNSSLRQGSTYQYSVHGKACKNEGETCDDSKSCCQTTEEQLCAYFGGSEKKCKSCSHEGGDCTATGDAYNENLCCPGYKCGDNNKCTDDPNAPCISNNQVCAPYGEVKCCDEDELYYYRVNEDSTSICTTQCQTKGGTCYKSNTEDVCCSDLFCDGTKHCSSCHGEGKDCASLDSGDTCCKYLKCNEATKKCCKAENSPCNTNDQDCCPGYECAVKYESSGPTCVEKCGGILCSANECCDDLLCVPVPFNIKLGSICVDLPGILTSKKLVRNNTTS